MQKQTQFGNGYIAEELRTIGWTALAVPTHAEA